MKKILMVLSSVSEIGDTGEQTGYNVAEAAHPWKVFKDSGHFVDLHLSRAVNLRATRLTRQILSRLFSHKTRPRVRVCTTQPLWTWLIPTSTTPSIS